MDTRFTPPYDGFAVGRDVLFHRPSSCPYWVSPYRARRQALAGIRYAAAARPANQVSGILDRPIKSGRPQLGSRQISFQTAKRTHARLPATRRARVVRKLPPPKNRGRGECRVPSAPAASCAHGSGRCTRVFTASSPESPGIPARNGFNGFLRALPGDRAFLPPSPAESLPPT
jgi:hypothetical protein